jgi:hypothetical protein
MTDKGLKNLYRRLRPNERFRLAVEAAGRDDGHEFALLSGSCPVHQYYATDEAYRSRLFAASYIAMHVANLLFRAQRDLAGPALARELLEDMKAVMMAEVGSDGGDGPTIEAGGDWPENAPEGERDELDNLYRERVAAVLGICEGFERFCDGLAVEPAKLLALEPSCPPAWHSAVRLRGKGIASDPAMAEAVYKLLEGFWSRLLYDQDSWLKEAIKS